MRQGAGAPSAQRLRAADEAAPPTEPTTCLSSLEQLSRSRSRCWAWTPIDLLSFHGLGHAELRRADPAPRAAAGRWRTSSPRRAHRPPGILNARAAAPAPRHDPLRSLRLREPARHYLFQDNLPAIAEAPRATWACSSSARPTRAAAVRAVGQAAPAHRRRCRRWRSTTCGASTNMDVQCCRWARRSRPISTRPSRRSPCSTRAPTTAAADRQRGWKRVRRRRWERTFARTLVARPARLDGDPRQGQRAPHPLALQPGARLRPDSLRAGALHHQ